MPPRRGPLTPVNDVVLMAPVDGFDELVDVVSHFLGRGTVWQLLQQLQHVLEAKVTVLPSGPVLASERRLCAQKDPPSHVHNT